VAWKKVCATFEEGGLNVRSLIALNEATNIKLCWDLLQSQEYWAQMIRSRVLRGNNCIRHHVFSSIWSSAKNEFNIIKDNSNWLVGNGAQINFWLDSWCGDPLQQVLNVSTDVMSNFSSSLNDYILNGHWHFPSNLIHLFPTLRNLAAQVIIPLQDKADTLVWNHTPSGMLTLKDAYEYKRHHPPKTLWAKSIWSKDIPPTKSLLAWRIMHDKVPTDDNLMSRGCLIPSRCSLCLSNNESTFHLFFQCPYAVNIWKWFASVLNLNLHFQTIDDIWSLCHKRWNPQCKLVVTSALINILNAIWYSRNQSRFNEKTIHWKSAISNIISSVSLSCNLSNAVASSAISDFIILKKLNVCIHPPKAPRIIEVIWHPPIFQWIKCNTDGSSSNNTSSCGGLFRDKDSKFILCFADNIGSGSAYIVELSGAMTTI